MDWLEIVDEHDRVIGQAPRSEIHARALRHRAVHVLLFNPAGELYLQQRAATKDTHPGRYDSSASGHVDPGESYEAAAVRELAEELNIQVAPAQLTPLFKLAASEQTGWEFVWVYQLQGNYHPQPNLAEITAGAFWTPPAIDALLANQPAQVSPAFVCIWREYRLRQH